MAVYFDRISQIFDPEEAPDEAAKSKTMKSIFLARWQLKENPSNVVHGMAKFKV